MEGTEINFREAKLKEMYEEIRKIPKGNIQMQAIIMKQNKEKEDIWSARELRITESLAKILKEKALSYIESLAEVEIKEFMVGNDQSDDYLIEKLPDSEVPVLNKILLEMHRDDNEDVSFEDLMKSTYLKGFAITFSKELIIFNKVTRGTILKPRKYLYIIPTTTGEFEGIEEHNILSIPTSIDTILYRDPLFIFNRKNFIQLFRYEELFDHFITDAEPNLEKIVDNVKALVEHSRHDIRKYRRLASACAGYVDRIVANNIDLKPIAIDYKLKVEFSNGMIDIQHSKLSDVLNLLNGQAVKDAIFGENYLAREKTKV
jgi:hypothetical protein